MKKSSAHSSEQAICEITCTDVLEHCFCPRFTYFELVMAVPEHQEKRFKVLKGREVHEEVQSINRSYLRKRIGCVDRKFNVHLSTPDGLIGIVDEVLELDDGTMAPLDYKFAEHSGRVYTTHRLQAAFYARLIEHAYQKRVSRGFVVYTRSKNKLVEISIGRRERDHLDRVVAGIREILSTGLSPRKAAGPNACKDCCYRNICDRGLE
jgi:CRISPR-associated exonuclease Cas4